MSDMEEPQIGERVSKPIFADFQVCVARETDGERRRAVVMICYDPDEGIKRDYVMPLDMAEALATELLRAVAAANEERMN